MSATETEADRLDRLEAKIDVILAKLEQAEQAFSGFITGPAIGKMFRAISGGGK